MDKNKIMRLVTYIKGVTDGLLTNSHSSSNYPDEVGQAVHDAYLKVMAELGVSEKEEDKGPSSV